MKSKGYGWLVFLGVPALVMFLSWPTTGGNLLLTLALPFTLAGEILRKLSLSGSMGNAAAWVLYLMVCASPLLLIRKADGWKKNGLLALASLVMLWVMWYMVNPDSMPLWMRHDVGRAVYAGAVYSVMLTWGVMKVLKGAESMMKREIYTALQVFLVILALICLLDGVTLGLNGYRTGLEAVSAKNTALSDSQLMPTYVFLTLEFCVDLVEHLLVVWILGLGIKLIAALEKDPYSQQCASLSGDILIMCRKTITIVLGLNLILNLGQVFCCDMLVNVDVTLHIPVLSLGLTFGMMALTRLLGEGKALKDDNDLFI